MSIVDQFKRVRCVSEFEDQPVSEALLATLMEAVSWTPSAADAQPWEFVAIREPERKAALVGTLLDSLLRPGIGGDERRHWLVDAPLVLVVCMDRTRAKARYGEIGAAVFGLQDTGAALQNLRLAALEHGLKSCLIREFDAARLSQLLLLPRHVQPLTLVALGFSPVEPPQKRGLPLEDILHHETW